jgi:hypothetical protein
MAKDRLNPFQLLRDNGNGTSRWAGPGGAELDVHHEAQGMEQFRPPQQRMADATDVAMARMRGESPAPNVPAATPGWLQGLTNPQPDTLDADMRDSERAMNQANQMLQQAAPAAPVGAGSVLAPTAPAGPAIPAANLAAGTRSTGPVVRDTTDPTIRAEHAVGAGGVGWQASGAAGAQPGTGFNYVGAAPGRRGTGPHLATVGGSMTVQTGARLPDGTIEGVQSGSEAAAQAAENTGKNERQELAQNAQTLADRNRIVGGLGGLMDRSVSSEQGRGNRLNQARLNFEDIANRARSMTVDPDRRSGGDRITGAIASLLGGIGSGITGGPNHAVQIIQHAIDRDVEAQRSNVANAQQGTAAAQTAYQLARDQGATEREAEALHMGFEYRRAADEMERLAALTGSSEAIDEARIRAEELRAHGAQLIGTLAHSSGDRTSTTTQQRMVGGNGSGPTTMVALRDSAGNLLQGTQRPLAGLPQDTQEAILRGDPGQLYGIVNRGAEPAGNANSTLSAGEQDRLRQYGIDRATNNEATTSASNLQQAMSGGSSPFGIGPFQGRVIPEWMMGEQGQAVVRESANLKNIVLQLRSGGQITDGEAGRLIEGIGNIVTEPYDLAVQDIARIRSRVEEASASRAAGYTPEVRQAYEQNRQQVGAPQQAAPLPSSFRPRQ